MNERVVLKFRGTSIGKKVPEEVGLLANFSQANSQERLPESPYTKMSLPRVQSSAIPTVTTMQIERVGEQDCRRLPGSKWLFQS